MPEGDTLFRTAARLRPVLLGQICHGGTARESTVRERLSRCFGETFESVESRGKHLLIAFSNQTTIHAHLGMTGAWHIYGRHDAWQKPRSYAVITLETDQHVVVCFTPKVLEILSPLEVKRHRWLNQLGGDVLDANLNREEVLIRLRQYNDLPIGEAMMVQEILCGIGNIYKSEVLFLCRLHPQIRVRDLADPLLLQIVDTAQQWMRRNRGRDPRRTRWSTDAHHTWVYRRAGQLCLKCGTPIVMFRQGNLGRVTYVCSRCQPPRQ